MNKYLYDNIICCIYCVRISIITNIVYLCFLSINNSVKNKIANSL